jgi:fumarate reductase subunit D
MVSLGRFNFSAISEIVMPVICLIIGILHRLHKNVHYKAQLLNTCIAKFQNIFRKIFFLTDNILTKCSLWCTIIYR